MARPGLEPATPRFSGSRFTDRQGRKACNSAPATALGLDGYLSFPALPAQVWDFTRALKSQMA
jgi:hypothetical protein